MTEIKGTHPTAHRVFVRWADEDKEVVWITDGRDAHDFYGATVAIPVESLDDFIEALKRLKEEV